MCSERDIHLSSQNDNRLQFICVNDKTNRLKAISSRRMWVCVTKNTENKSRLERDFSSWQQYLPIQYIDIVA